MMALAAARTWAAESSPLSMRGSTLDGRPFDLGRLRGKVVLVFYWATDCAVCRSKLPELRANAMGWRDKPFEIVRVSVDRRRADVVAYENTLAAVLPGEPRQAALWRGDADYADNLPEHPGRLPLSLVLDRTGREAARFEGRIPAEAWDRIADLLP
jgi:thiol-disulfide isomerase/thioredoxin